MVQLVLTVSFQQPLDLTIVETAEVASLFADDYPVYRQIDRAGIMAAAPVAVPDITQMIGLPRLQFAAEDLTSQILFQNDRLSFGWNRQTPLDHKPDYPGFAATFATFEQHLSTLREWADDRETPIMPAVGELHYTDAFSLADMPAPKRADQFRFFNPDFIYPVASFNFSWVQAIVEGRPGFLQGIIASPGTSPAGVKICTLQTIARMDVTAGWDAVASEFAQAHQAIHEVYNRVVNPAALAKSKA